MMILPSSNPRPVSTMWYRVSYAVVWYKTTSNGKQFTHRLLHTYRVSADAYEGTQAPRNLTLDLLGTDHII